MQGITLLRSLVTDDNGSSISKDLILKVNLGCGNAGYSIIPDDDPTYTVGMSDNSLPIMTVKEGISGFQYFSVTITPVKGHTGKEVVIFVHYRNGAQIGLAANKADFDMIDGSMAGFNVQAGDIIKVYMVDDLSNDPAVNPTVL